MSTIIHLVTIGAAAVPIRVAVTVAQAGGGGAAIIAITEAIVVAEVVVRVAI